MKMIEPLRISPDTMAYEPFAVRPAGDPLLVLSEDEYLVAEFTSNVPEDDYDEWDAGTTFVVGAWTMWAHHVFQALSENTNKDPTENPDIWQDAGYTNRYRMFDEKISTSTTNEDSIEVSFAPGSPIDSVAFFGVDAGGVRVKSIDPYLGTIFDKEVAPVSTDGIDNWYAYFFAPIELTRDFVIIDIPASSFGTVEITITKIDGVARVGSVVIGPTFFIGDLKYGTSIGIIDYSRKERDEYGNYLWVERGFSKRAEFDVAIETDRVSKVQKKLTKYRARPTVWVGHEDVEATLIYGPYRDFDIVLSNPAYSDCTITVEGLN